MSHHCGSLAGPIVAAALPEQQAEGAKITTVSCFSWRRDSDPGRLAFPSLSLSICALRHLHTYWTRGGLALCVKHGGGSPKEVVSKPLPAPHCFPPEASGNPEPWCFFGSSLGGQRRPGTDTTEEQLEPLMPYPAAASTHDLPCPTGTPCPWGLDWRGWGGPGKLLGQGQ